MLRTWKRTKIVARGEPRNWGELVCFSLCFAYESKVGITYVSVRRKAPTKRERFAWEDSRVA